MENCLHILLANNIYAQSISYTSSSDSEDPEWEQAHSKEKGHRQVKLLAATRRAASRSPRNQHKKAKTSTSVGSSISSKPKISAGTFNW